MTGGDIGFLYAHPKWRTYASRTPTKIGIPCYANFCTHAKLRTYPRLHTCEKYGGNLTLPREFKAYKETKLP